MLAMTESSKIHACGLRWARAFAQDAASSESQVKAVAEAYVHCTRVRQTEYREVDGVQVWRLGREGIAWPDGGLPRHVCLWNRQEHQRTRRSIQHDLSDAALRQALGQAFAANAARTDVPDETWFPITSYSRRYIDMAREMRRNEIEAAFALAGVPFGGLYVGEHKEKSQAVHAYLSRSRLWLARIGVLLRSFRQALPAEVVSACYAVRDPALGMATWLLAGGGATAWRCQALRAQPWAIGTALRLILDMGKDGCGGGNVWLSDDDAEGEGWSDEDEAIRQREARLLLGRLEQAIDGGRSWRAALGDLCEYLGSRVPAEAAGSDGRQVFFCRSQAPMRGEWRMFGLSRASLGFLEGRRLGNTPLFVDARRGIGGHCIDFARGLSGPRRPQRRRDWAFVQHCAKVQAMADGTLGADAFMAGAPVDWRDPWFAKINTSGIPDAWHAMCEQCEQRGGEEIAAWLQALGHGDNGALLGGQWLTRDAAQAGLRLLTLRQWVRLAGLFHTRGDRATEVVRAHPPLGAAEGCIEWSVQAEPHRHGGLVLHELHDDMALNAEGEAMHHCVGGGWYAEACVRGEARILSIRTPDGERLATAEIRWRKDGRSTGAQVAQCWAMGNTEPAAKVLAAVRSLVRKGYPKPEPGSAEMQDRAAGRHSEASTRSMAWSAWLADCLWREARRHPCVDAAVREASRNGGRRVAR